MCTNKLSNRSSHRWFAAMYDCVSSWGERRVLRHLRPMVAGEATGYMLEIGVGTGANFPYYKLTERIVATEPDPFMLRRAQRRAAHLGLPVEFHQCPAEELPFSDASFDTVVLTLALCTVRDPPRALREIRRVLKPGGPFRFIEHVRSDSRLTGLVQDLLTPVWRWFGAGCHLNRKTIASIEAAGFELVEVHHRHPPLLPLLPFVVGVARTRP